MIIAGIGISLYNIERKEKISFFDNKDNIMFTWGIYQNIQGYSYDDLYSEVRFFSDCGNKICLYKFDFIEEKLTKIANLDEVINWINYFKILIE